MVQARSLTLLSMNRLQHLGWFIVGSPSGQCVLFYVIASVIMAVSSLPNIE